MASSKSDALRALRRNGDVLAGLAPRLRDDEDVCRRAAITTGRALRMVHDELRRDKRFLLSVLRSNGHALAFVDEDLRGDRQLVMTAVKSHGEAIAFAPECLRRDREVLLNAIHQTYSALRHAGDLFGDAAFMLEVLALYPDAFRRATSALQLDRAFVLAAARRNGEVLWWASAEWLQDREVLVAAVQSSADCVALAPEHLLKDRSFILDCIEENYRVLDVLRVEWDESLALEAIGRRCESAKRIPLMSDRDFVLRAAGVRGRVIEHLRKPLDRDVALRAVTQDGSALEFTGRWRADEEVSVAAVGQYWRAFAHCFEPSARVLLAAAEALPLAQGHEDRVGGIIYPSGRLVVHGSKVLGQSVGTLKRRLRRRGSVHFVEEGSRAPLRDHEVPYPHESLSLLLSGERRLPTLTMVTSAV
jgi:uncharacterized protein YoaH (UPF0181 family)